MSNPARWRFGHFVADLHEHQLLRDGAPVPVTRKALRLLSMLLSHSGRLVTKTELFDTVWAGSVVTDAALSRVIRELRIALGDDAGAPRYIATVHGHGFRFIAEVVTEAAVEPNPHAAAVTAGPAAQPGARAPVPQDAGAPALRPGPASAGLRWSRQRAHGREAELTRLEQALAAALQGRRQLVFVSGPAGIGKTALVENFVDAVAQQQAWVGLGRCIESYGSGEPYLPVLEALDGLTRQGGSAATAQLLLQHAPAWLAQLPWLASEVDGTRLQQALAGATPQRMLREAAQALEALAEHAAGRAVVLWLEDLHWSDPSTLELLAWVAGRREPARLMIVASLRAGEVTPSVAALPSLVQQLVQRAQAFELVLQPLDEQALADWLHWRAPPAEGHAPDVTRQLARCIHRRTEGHALFAAAVLDDLVRRGELRPGPTGWVYPGARDELGLLLPDSVRQWVQRLIDRLDDGERRLVEAAAVAGTDFCAAMVAAALDEDAVAIEERVLRLLQSGRLLRHRSATLWPDGTESAGFGFRHALVWQGVYEGVALTRRIDWQRRIAERQQQAFADQPELIAAELAMRFEAARQPARAVPWLRLAGDAALRRFAYREGAEHLTHALTLVDSLPEAVRERAEAELHLVLGAAQMAAFGYAAPEVETTYRRARELCRRCGRAGEIERALRGLWNVALVRAQLDEAQLAADELMLQAAAHGDRSAMFDAFAKLGQTAMHRGQFGVARQHLEHALALPLPPVDALRRREAPRVLAYLSWVLWYGGDPTAALRRGQEALSTAPEAGAHTLAFALGFTGWLHEFRGEPEQTLALARQQHALAVEHGLVYWRVWSEALQGLALGRLSNPPHAASRAALRQALDDFAAQGAEVGLSHFRCAEAELALAAGDLAAARTAVARSAALLARNGNAYHAAETLRLQGELACAAGDMAMASPLFEAALAKAQSVSAHALALRAALSLAEIAGPHRQSAMQRLQGVRAQLAADADGSDVRRADHVLGAWNAHQSHAAFVVGQPGRTDEISTRRGTS